MRKYFDVVFLTTSIPAAGAYVYVLDSSGNRVPLFSDNGITSIPNPVTTDRTGFYSFYVADGKYTLQYVLGGITLRTITDVSISEATDLTGPSGSSEVGFIQSGTGAVARTVAAELNDLSVSVKRFGVKGDGVADDTAALQAGLSYLGAVGGGTLQVPRGLVCGISATLLMSSNTRMVGEGIPIIRAIAPITGAMLQFGWTTGAMTVADTNACSNSSVEGIEFDGNHKVISKNWDPLGTVAASLLSAVVYGWRNSPRNKVIACKVHGAESDLIGCEDGADFFEVRDCEAYDLYSNSAATQYVNFLDIDGPENALIEGNYLHGQTFNGYTPSGGFGYGIRLHANDASIVRRNRVTAGYHGIYCDGRKNLIQCNDISGTTRSGIVLYYNAYKCLYNTVSGNFINSPATPIYEDDTGQTGYVGWNTISGNTAYGATGDITIKNQGTVLTGNNIYSDAGVTLLARQTILGLSGGSTSSDFATGSWSPTIVNQTNVSGAVASGCRFVRIGNIVKVMGTIAFTATASGACELRISAPTSNIFASDSDAAGAFADTWSINGSVYALVQSGTQYLRLSGQASSSGSKTVRFTAMYVAN